MQVSEEAGYMAAMFQTPLQAIMFALRVHDDLFHFDWSEDILSLVGLGVSVRYFCLDNLGLFYIDCHSAGMFSKLCAVKTP